MHRSLLSAVLSLSVLLSPLVAAQDASYTFTTLDVPGAGYTVAFGINTAGQIVGLFYQPGPLITTHGFLTSDGATFTTIDVPNSTYNPAFGINESGQIVGTFDDATVGRRHGFLKDGDTFTTIDVPGATSTEAHGINESGQIVGVFSDATGDHGFLTDGNTFTTINAPGAMATYALGINDHDQIVGWFDDATGRHGFLTDGDTFTPIDVPGATSTQAREINATGQIVGIFSDGGRFRGFVKDGATFTIIDLPGTSYTLASGINAAGQVVGQFSDGTTDHGFLATPVVVDITPPVITVVASPATLSPPNGRLVTVTVSGTITDESGGSGVQASTYQVIDEYGQVQPSGNITLVNGQYGFTVALQASRRGNDPDGRHYMIAVSAKDNAGNRGGMSATVTVPHN